MNKELYKTKKLSLRACPVCRNTTFEDKYCVAATIFHQEKYRINTGKVVECQNCGLHYTNPTLNEKLDVDQYINEASGYNKKIYKSAEELCWDDQVLCLCELKEHLKCSSDKILDFACGRGGFVYLCEKSGILAKGIDLNFKNIELGKALGVRNIDSADIQDEADDSYDFVVALHVLEHCRELRSILGEFHRVLKPEGKVLTVVPNYHSLKFAIRPLGFWKSVYMHINGFTGRHLDMAFAKHGFVRVPLKAYFRRNSILNISRKNT